MQNVTQIIETISTHPALNNHFYERWVSAPLPIHHIAVFVRNYWEWTFRFPEALARLILNIENVTARAEYTKTLFSEMGYGEPEAVHSVLFEKFFYELAKNMGHPHFLDIVHLKDKINLLPATVAIIGGEKKLYTDNPSIAAGAQLALEWQAFTMMSKLYEGARNYSSFWPCSDDFHDACEFFYVHIGSAEKAHKLESLNAVNKVVQDADSFEKFSYGFHAHLNLIANFWNGIASCISEY